MTPEAARRWAVMLARADGRKRYVFAVRSWTGAWMWKVSTSRRLIPRDPYANYR